ncbi:glutamate--tRNA ligase [Candidatus Desantisbacteria bacterium]|nr:glutamate--tRNA ligase [Candidatus Desantisbacteria bacterium]
MEKNKITDIRVRFAPSPTGHLHVGGARTALFNWLFARHHNGKFILRIEDTDEERSSAENTGEIIRSLKWLGLEWDEGPDKPGEYGPYLQSERNFLYKKYIEKLLAEDKAYRCFCTQEELASEKTRAESEKRQYRYSGKCSHLTDEEINSFLEQKRPYVVRLRIPKGETVLNDVIRGRIEFKNEIFDDFIIQKSSGGVVYNFAVVIDDALMNISHVIRGDDHISNTPKQIIMYEALGFSLPVFAHVSMILGGDGKRLSKRHGAVSVDQYRDDGLFPEAVVNYLALLGWSTSDSRQFFHLNDLIKAFSLENISSNPAIFDIKKLEWLSCEHWKLFDRDLKRKYAVECLTSAGFVSGGLSKDEIELLDKALALVGDRIKKTGDILIQINFFFKKEINYPENILKKYFSSGTSFLEVLDKIVNSMEQLENFNEIEIEKIVKGQAALLGIKDVKLMQVIRVVLTGQEISAGIFETIMLLGKNKTVERIKNIVRKLGS